MIYFTNTLRKNIVVINEVLRKQTTHKNKTVHNIYRRERKKTGKQ